MKSTRRLWVWVVTGLVLAIVLYSLIQGYPLSYVLGNILACLTGEDFDFPLLLLTLITGITLLTAPYCLLGEQNRKKRGFRLQNSDGGWYAEENRARINYLIGLKESQLPALQGEPEQAEEGDKSLDMRSSSEPLKTRTSTKKKTNPVAKAGNGQETRFDADKAPTPNAGTIPAAKPGETGSSPEKKAPDKKQVRRLKDQMKAYLVNKADREV